MITRFTGDYGFLSNFYPHVQVAPWFAKPAGPLRRWRTNEHYFQAAKVTTPEAAWAIARSATPAEAKRLGRQVAIRDDWEAVRLDVMLTGLRAKFLDNAMAEQLLDTGTLELVEGNAWGDDFWGMTWKVATGKPDGQNWLGKLLMLVRAETQGRMR